MREIVTFQVGGFANFVGSHFWNFQVNNFIYLFKLGSPEWIFIGELDYKVIIFKLLKFGFSWGQYVEVIYLHFELVFVSACLLAQKILRLYAFRSMLIRNFKVIFLYCYDHKLVFY